MVCIVKMILTFTKYCYAKFLCKVLIVFNDSVKKCVILGVDNIKKCVSKVGKGVRAAETPKQKRRGGFFLRVEKKVFPLLREFWAAGSVGRTKIVH